MYNDFTNRSMDNRSMDKPLLATLIRRLHLLIRQRVHDDLRAAGHLALAPAHMYVFQSPGPDGARPTELAERTNMTKQAMNHLLAGLERDGYLDRIPSPSDGRGTVIRLTDRGRDVEHIMHEGAARLEREWAKLTSRGDIEQLRALLREVDAAVEDSPERL
jgi:DNA-binding MarR family transcriptional regulator